MSLERDLPVPLALMIGLGVVAAAILLATWWRRREPDSGSSNGGSKKALAHTPGVRVLRVQVRDLVACSVANGGMTFPRDRLGCMCSVQVGPENA